MNIKFFKYHGTANDFVMIDNRSKEVSLSKDQVSKICDRRTGVGADGLILLQNHKDFDFEMIYYNADGREGTMCGNGGRCIVAFAKQLGIINESTSFIAIDGAHNALIDKNNRISLEMIHVEKVILFNEDYVLDTGSPHYVQFCSNLKHKNVFVDGSSIRNSDRFIKEGINVNFVEVIEDVLHIRTFERGVEEETWSCGTGVVASSIAYAKKNNLTGSQEINISTKGGNLSVTFDNQDSVTNIWLIGPAICVFEGELKV